MILCSYPEVILSSKQVLNEKEYKLKTTFAKSKLDTTVTKTYKDTDDNMESKLHLIYLTQDLI